MGDTTDYLGHITISPPLNEQERRYLGAVRDMRHYDRGGSTYDVPPNPTAPDPADVPVERYDAVQAAKPSLRCGWAVCGDGCCVSHDGIEKFNDPDRWLTYLVEHLLGPGAEAAGTGHPQLDGFTFDHHLDGVVVGHRRWSRELFALVVVDNEISYETLVPGDDLYGGYAPLAYEEQIDRWSSRRTDRSRDSPAARARGAIARVQVASHRSGPVTAL